MTVAGGERGGVEAITNDVIKFERSRLVISFSYISLIINGKDYLSIKNLVKNLRN